MLCRLATDPRALSIAAGALGGKVEELSFSGTLFRMDAPFDKRNTLQWHQDHTFYPQNRDGGNGLVMTVAIGNASADMGAVQLCAGSHKEGLVKAELGGKNKWSTTSQRVVPDKLVQRYQEICPDLETGDTLFIHLDLFHRSGYNQSDLVRITALCRYHLMMEEDYTPHRMTLEFNTSLMKEKYHDTDPPTRGR